MFNWNFIASEYIRRGIKQKILLSSVLFLCVRWKDPSYFYFQLECEIPLLTASQLGEAWEKS
jgi:hypothetical protein